MNFSQVVVNSVVLLQQVHFFSYTLLKLLERRLHCAMVCKNMHSIKPMFYSTCLKRFDWHHLCRVFENVTRKGVACEHKELNLMYLSCLDQGL